MSPFCSWTEDTQQKSPTENRSCYQRFPLTKNDDGNWESFLVVAVRTNRNGRHCSVTCGFDDDCCYGCCCFCALVRFCFSYLFLRQHVRMYVLSNIKYCYLKNILLIYMVMQYQRYTYAYCVHMSDINSKSTYECRAMWTKVMVDINPVRCLNLIGDGRMTLFAFAIFDKFAQRTKCFI